MVYRSVVYRNGIGVMNIQLAEEYKNAEKGEMERGFQELDPGLERRSWSQGPNSEDAVGAGAREKRDAVKNMSMKRRD